MSDEPLIWIDGAPEQALPLPDRGVDFGDGLFETLLVQKGRAQLPDLHLARLRKGLLVLGFPDCSQNVQADIERICQTIASNSWEWSALRATVTRGGGPRGYAPPADTVPRVVLTATKLERDARVRTRAARLCQADIKISRQPALAGIKHLNRLEQVMASAQASAAGFDEALLCDDGGRVVSVAAGNIFAVFENEILTPTLHYSGVAGTRRHYVMAHCAPRLGLKVREADMSLEKLLTAQEVFYTNTLVGIRPVASIEEHSWPEGGKTLALSGALPERVRLMRILLIALSLLAIAAVLVYTEIDRRWGEPLAIPSSGFELVVAPGDSLRSVAASLHADGVLAYPELLVLHARWARVDGRIRQGEYLLREGLTPASLLEQLIKGDVRRYQVTLPEGITLLQALDILWSEPRLTRTIQDSQDVRIGVLVEPYARPEGLFFPDSYQYTRGDSDWSILQRAHRAMAEALQQEWESREEGVPLETPYEALILASIVEKETGVASERAAIAGVFTRRLIKRMRLQTDPTVIYGLGGAYKGNLTRRHLADDANVYNTYRHHGLPPTPIALPGREAIHAALHPAQGTALYFVARGDGSHTFSDTLAEHNSAVRKYQLKRRQDYRSSPESR